MAAHGDRRALSAEGERIGEGHVDRSATRDAIIRCEKNQLAATISELLLDTARRERLGAAKRYAAGVVVMKMAR